MWRLRTRRGGVVATVVVVLGLGCLGLGAGAASGKFTGSEVVTGNLILRANGGVVPSSLPRSKAAPIALRGQIDLSTKDGSVPPPLQSVTLELDRDGRLTTAGLPVCPPARIENAGVAAARRLCRGAIVGSGHVSAVVRFPNSKAYTGGSPVTFFNGPRVGGMPSVVIHAVEPTYPRPRPIVIPVPIERIHRGLYGYRVTIAIPEIAEGDGALLGVSFDLHRLFKSHGRPASYVSASCGRGYLTARGALVFGGEGLSIVGPISKPCTVVSTRRTP